MPQLCRVATMCQFGWSFGVVLGCGPAVSTDDDGDTTPGVAAGVQPTELGAMYSACVDVRECVPLSLCVFPPGEGGYCWNPCAAVGDHSGCAPAPGDGAEISCLDIREPDGREVCALDCSDGACPEGMRCEGIDTAGGERRICF